MAHDAVQTACRLIARTYYGSRGTWLYDAYDLINEAFYDRELPTPLITIEITPHSACLAWCSNADDRPPRIAIHPTLFGLREKDRPWDVPNEWLGVRYVFDALLHETIHASVHYRLGGWEDFGPTSHNNDLWVAEVNRIAPQIGFKNVEAGRQICKRIPVGRKRTKRGRRQTRVAKVDLGNVPFITVATFPSGLRQHQGKADNYYRRGRLPVSPTLLANAP